jgi:hypothetical protein
MENGSTRARPRLTSPGARELPRQDLILNLLGKIERLREQADLVARRLTYLLATGRDAGGADEDYNEPVDVALLQATWDAFLAAGGVTADDLTRFLNGEQLGAHPVKRRRHLRLIRSNNPHPPGERKWPRVEIRKNKQHREAEQRQAEEIERQGGRASKWKRQ